MAMQDIDLYLPSLTHLLAVSYISFIDVPVFDANITLVNKSKLRELVLYDYYVKSHISTTMLE